MKERKNNVPYSACTNLSRIPFTFLYVLVSSRCLDVSILFCPLVFVRCEFLDGFYFHALIAYYPQGLVLIYLTMTLYGSVAQFCFFKSTCSNICWAFFGLSSSSSQCVVFLLITHSLWFLSTLLCVIYSEEGSLCFRLWNIVDVCGNCLFISVWFWFSFVY